MGTENDVCLAITGDKKVYIFDKKEYIFVISFGSFFTFKLESTTLLNEKCPLEKCAG